MNSTYHHQQRSGDQQFVLQQHQMQVASQGGIADSSKSSLTAQTMNSNMQDRHQGDPEMWAQKINYADQRTQDLVQHSLKQNGADGAKNRRGSNITAEHPQQNLGKPTLDLQQNTNMALGAAGSRQGSAKHASIKNGQDDASNKRGGFFGQGSAGTAAETSTPGADNITTFINKNQVIQSSSGADGVDAKQNQNNERANRINLHRSNRQRSHQGQNPQGQEQSAQYYEKASKSGQSGVPEVKIQLKNGKQSSDLDVVYYQGHPPDSTKNSTQYHQQLYSAGHDNENQLYQTQKIESTQAMLQHQFNQQQNFKQSQQQNNKVDSSQQPQYYDQQDSSLTNSKQQMQQQTNNQMAPQGQHGAEPHHRRGSEANSHGTNHKKKVQPPQPRNREESTSRRSGAAGPNIHNKSSETTNSYDQSSQNSSTGLQQPQGQTAQRLQQQQQQPQAQQINTDKFSQLVCQVPQGENAPRMSDNNQPNPQIQVQDGANSNFNNQFLLGPQRASEAGRKTLVLDLDETLVHSSFKPVENADIMLPVEIDGQICTIYVLVRPFVAQFLKRMHKIYELVIFTASLSKYAEPLMTHLDPQKMCSYLLFREHCTFFNNAYVKDLTRLGRPMKDVIIVDNSPVAYLFQPENAMPAVSWYDEPSDTELNRIDALLQRMVHEEDVRKIIRTVIQNNKIDPRQEQLYMASSSAQHRRDKSQRVDRRTKHSNKLSTSNQQATTSDNQNQQQTDQLQNKAPQQQSSQTSVVQQQKQSFAPPNAPATAASGAAQAASGTHSRYDSSDTRQRNAALISEEINQRKRGDEDNVNMEIVLSNVQKLTQQASDLQYQSTLKKSMQQNQNDIQQAYQHHKNQILQLKNEIAALKSQQTGKTPRSSDQQDNEVVIQTANDANPSQRRSNEQQQQVAPSSTKHAKTTNQVQRVVHQQIGKEPQNESQKTSPVKSGNKGQKQREVVQSTHQKTAVVQKSNVNGKQTQQRQSYKILSTNEIQLVNYLKSNTNGQPTSSNASGATNQRHSINVEKKQLVVRESLGNNSQLHNTKQIIKLIKKSEGHSSHIDVSGAARQNFQQIDPSERSSQQPQASQPNIQASNQATGASYNRQSHPATTKSQTKQHFAFTTQNQGQATGATQQVRQSQQSQPFTGQINMIQSTGVAARGQQASRTSSKTTKNYATSAGTANTGNIRTSYSSTKHGAHTSKVAQSSLQAHERITTSGVVGGTSQTKRSSSVKNSSQGHHHVRRQSNDKDHNQVASSSHHNHRKGNNSSAHQNGSNGQGYSNLGAYEQTGNRRERGNSAQPNYSGGTSHHGPSVNPLLVTNIVSRSSSTTNKNKKVNSISGAGNFHNLVLNGSHSTKHSTQQAHHGHNPTTQSILQNNSSGQQRGGSQDRHQQKTSTRQPTRIKSASGKSIHGHGSDSKDEHHHHKSSKTASSSQQYNLKQQQEHLQRMQQMQQQQVSQNGGIQQLSATQRISPGTMLNLAAQYGPGPQGQNSQQLLNSSLTPSHHQQQAQVVKQNLKDIQVQDMLRLTQGNTQGPQGYFQTGMSSTRNQKQVAQIGGHHSVQQQEADDFLKKVKLQQQTVKGSKDQHTAADLQQRRTTEQVKGVKNGPSGGSNITIMHQEGTISKSSQGHQSMGQVVNSLTINSPKYANGQHHPSGTSQGGTNGGSTRDQQKILNDIMNMSSMQREQKSGSAATSYATKQIHHITTSGAGNNSSSNNPASGGSNGHQIKKIRISSNQQNNTGRTSGQSNQSAPNHKSSGLKRGDSNHSRGSHSSAIHVVRTNGSTSGNATKGQSRDQARQAQLFNQTMKLKDSSTRGGGTGGGILSLLGDMANSDSQDKDLKNQTAADLFLKTHNEEQFSQTQYIGSAAGSHLGNNQLREVTRHFYNQLSSQGSGNAGGSKQSKQQHQQQAPQ